MPRHFASGLLVALLTTSVAPAADPPKPPARCGQIFVAGNESTPLGFILDRMPMCPGMVLRQADLATAERALAATCLFRPVQNTGKYVSVLANPHDQESPYKDVLITVEELPHTRWVWAAADCTIHRPLSKFHLVIDLGQVFTAWASPSPERTPLPPR